jgi:hypothetical protein
MPGKKVVNSYSASKTLTSTAARAPTLTKFLRISTGSESNGKNPFVYRASTLINTPELPPNFWNEAYSIHAFALAKTSNARLKQQAKPPKAAKGHSTRALANTYQAKRGQSESSPENPMHCALTSIKQWQKSIHP